MANAGASKQVYCRAINFAHAALIATKSGSGARRFGNGIPSRGASQAAAKLPPIKTPRTSSNAAALRPQPGPGAVGGWGRDAVMDEDYFFASARLRALTMALIDASSMFVSIPAP
jgi:hypothetical protein